MPLIKKGSFDGVVVVEFEAGSSESERIVESPDFLLDETHWRSDHQTGTAPTVPQTLGDPGFVSFVLSFLFPFSDPLLSLGATEPDRLP